MAMMRKGCELGAIVAIGLMWGGAARATIVTATANLAPQAVSSPNAAAYTVDMGVTFSSITSISWSATFSDDLLDDGECFGTCVDTGSGFDCNQGGACNVGGPSRSSQSVSMSCSGYPIQCNQMLDGFHSGGVHPFAFTFGGSASFYITALTVTADGVIGPPPVCGNGVHETGEQCDDGNTTNGDCCSATCQYEPSGSPCPNAGYGCSATDLCSATGTCIHGPSPSGTVCRPAAGVCDIAETCDGVSAVCPGDQFLPTSVVCRASAGACDLVEHCTGAAGNCPSDATLSSGTICRGAAGDCDVAEACDGSTAACPADAKQPSGTPCNDNSLCTQTDRCNGSGTCIGSNPLDCNDNDACTADVCDPDGGCVNDDAPATGCLTAQQSLLLVQHHATDDTKDKLIWKWIKGAQVDQTTLSDPTDSDRYGLCIYVGSGNTLVARAGLPPGTGWSALGTNGYKFKGGSPNGLTNALLKGGAADKSKALAKGKGALLPDPTLPFTYPVTVQLRKDGATLCLESTFTSFDEVKNDGTQFKATH